MTATGAPVHSTIARFRSANGQLVVGGVELVRLAAQVGSTPFFAYERAAITERIDLLHGLLGPLIGLSYAIKANPMPAVVQYVAGRVEHLDVASSGELKVALDAGMPATRVSFAGPGKKSAELRSAVAAGITVEVESSLEAERLVAIGAELGIRPRVAVRVNPDFAVRGSGMRMGGGPQQFGMDAEIVPAFLSDLAAYDIEFVGLHVFSGSQNLHSGILAEAQDRTVDLVLRLADAAPGPLRQVNLGGGFGIPYHDRDEPLDVEAVCEHLRNLAQERLAPALPEAALCLELGRFLVGEAGVYVTEIIDRKVSRGRTYLVVDGGLHHQLAATGNLGAAIRRNYPLVIGNRMSGDDTDRMTASVVGCLCTPIDVLGDNVEVPASTDIGDLVVIFQAGAYGKTASPADFLGHPAAFEVLVGPDQRKVQNHG
ncbi:pyridoxal-dependent decarboxylase, exosortase A system-associated [Flexivirga alba]|uniref:Pyridoxal-dependent decarboxylase, exosortase A system-associated n=1 Tax=Flexivirga alba TaxID=702742 RepID=A0ABW2AFW1_9MICO